MLAASLSSLISCTAMDEQQCRSVDWQEKGSRDAQRGLKAQTIERYAQACREFGVSANVDAYTAGWNSGIKDYCTRDNGWKTGLAETAASYSHTCPKNLEAEFYSAYQLGRAVREARDEVEDVRRELDEVLEKLAGQELSDDRRTALNKKRKNLKKELSSAQWHESQAEKEARDMGFAI
tara:strand:+ start:33886 stop:34422 length:537 start_codon:yes stop_codon:yes gene_type:complete